MDRAACFVLYLRAHPLTRALLDYGRLRGIIIVTNQRNASNSYCNKCYVDGERDEAVGVFVRHGSSANNCEERGKKLRAYACVRVRTRAYACVRAYVAAGGGGGGAAATASCSWCLAACGRSVGRSVGDMLLM